MATASDKVDPVPEQEERLTADKKESTETPKEKGGGESLESLCSMLRQQMHSTNWLEKNTPEKWQKENPELAKAYMDAQAADKS